MHNTGTRNNEMRTLDDNDTAGIIDNEELDNPLWSRWNPFWSLKCQFYKTFSFEIISQEPITQNNQSCIRFNHANSFLHPNNKRSRWFTSKIKNSKALYLQVLHLHILKRSHLMLQIKQTSYVSNMFKMLSLSPQLHEAKVFNNLFVRPDNLWFCLLTKNY